MNKKESMRSKSSGVTACYAPLLLGVVILTCALVLQAQTQSAAPKTFDTPQLAADALIQAAGNDDVPAMLAIFGPDGKDIVSTADPVQDKNRLMGFAERAKEHNAVAVDPKNKSQATLIVGNGDWPFPVPIVMKAGKWSFDSKQGVREILLRRIGTNELDAIQVCRGFVDAQEVYASQAHDGINQYAQKIISTPGKQDGLYWENPDGTGGGPISGAVARAIAEGYSAKQPTGYHGYYFKVLKGQGPAAPMGELNYVIEGVMIGGFALAATPAEYRVTGVKTFIVSYEGVVYEKDLGPDSVNIFKKMDRYNPDKTWRPTDAEWPADVAGAEN